MKRETLGHYNVLYTNPDDVIHGDVLAMTHVASVFDLNEGSSVRPIRAALEAAGFEYIFNGHSDWLCWDPKVWSTRPWHHVWKVAPGAKEYGLDVPVNPARYLMAQCLDHIESGTRHDFYATHLTAGYASPDSAHNWSPALIRYKDFAGKAGVLNVDRITKSAIQRRERVDFHHLLGDMNSQQRNDRQEWYPANVWDGTWVPDTMPNSIDWMLHSVAAKKHGLDVVRRWAERDHKPGAKGWDSDHPAHFKTVAFPVK